MDISHIPRSFWHAISLCMVSTTFGLLYIAYKSSTVSLEIANAKINLSSAISTVKDIKVNLQAENTRLVKANQELKTKIEELQDKAVKSATGISIEDLKSKGILGGESSFFRKPMEFGKVDQFQALEARIKSAEKALQ